MAKKKEKNEEKESFNLEEMYKTVNPYLIEGLKRYIFVNDIEIKNEKEFKQVCEKYGGF